MYMTHVECLSVRSTLSALMGKTIHGGSFCGSEKAQLQSAFSHASRTLTMSLYLLRATAMVRLTLVLWELHSVLLFFFPSGRGDAKVCCRS
jgi:hypothetical protein